MAKPTFEPTKNYRYTWPGLAPKVVTGAELAIICAGADPSALNIQEISAESKQEVSEPKSKKEEAK